MCWVVLAAWWNWIVDARSKAKLFDGLYFVVCTHDSVVSCSSEEFPMPVGCSIRLFTAARPFPCLNQL